MLPSNTAAQNAQNLRLNLMRQALDAIMGHAQATTPPTDQQLQQIVAFETALYTAQVADKTAGFLTAKGALGGPQNLSTQPFYVGINDPLGQNPTGATFDPNAFTTFDAWSSLSGSNATTAARESVACGEAIFNTRTFNVSGVGGLNDALGKPVIAATCTTCHDTPNVGNHSVSVPLNIGVADGSRRTPNLPFYTLKCVSGPLAGQTFQTTDPGRALISGKCADIGKFKGPILRGLAARAPYFHDGSATRLQDVVNFYDSRFNIGFTPQEEADLLAFLQSL